MRAILSLAVLLACTVPVFADWPYSSDDVQVNGYYRSNGTYVAPHYRSAPNAYRWDNYSYQPSQPAYNAPRFDPSPSWNTPNPGRFNDSNPYNNWPRLNTYQQNYR